MQDSLAQAQLRTKTFTSSIELDVRCQKANGGGALLGPPRAMLHLCSALLRGTLVLRSPQEEPGRRNSLLSVTDKLLKTGRKRGWAQARGGAGDPLGEQSPGCGSL